MPDPYPLSATDPQHIGDFQLIGLLGQGGQGVVYLGESPAGSRVAIKVLHARMARTPEAHRRFVREAAAARQVAPFCTARVLDVGITGDQPYIVSEHVPGISLQELVTNDGPRLGGGLDRLAIATLTALSAIHRVGIVHRDFKPANVLMGPEGPVVIDFGIARMLDGTATASEPIGTPSYMAPEIFDRDGAGIASDMFAWAATMVFAATGHGAFSRASTPAVIHAILTQPLDLSGVPAELQPVLAACLEKHPDARPDASDVLRSLTGEASPYPGARPHAIPSPEGESSSAPVEEPSAAPDSAATGQTPPHRPPAVPSGPGGDATDPTARSLRDLTHPSSRSPSGHPIPAAANATELDDEPTAQPASPTASADPDLPCAPQVLTTGQPPARPSRLLTRCRVLIGLPLAAAAGVGVPVLLSTLRQPKLGDTLNGSIYDVAVGQMNGKAIALSTGNGDPLRLWDLVTGTQIGRPLADDAAGVEVGQLNGRTVAITSDFGGTVRVWDLVTRTRIGESFTSAGSGSVLAIGELNGTAIVVTQSGDDTVRVWDLAAGKQIGQPRTGHTGIIGALAVGQFGGRTIAVSGDGDGKLLMWNLGPS